MSLYDGLGGLGVDAKEKEKVELAGWSSGIKLLQTQLQLKKAAQGKKDHIKKGVVLPPVVDLKSRKEETEEPPPMITPIFIPNKVKQETKIVNASASLFGADPEWNVRDEYNPMWPNDYEKIIKEKRERKEKEREEDRKRDYEERERRRRERYNRDREDELGRRKKEEDEEEEERPRKVMSQGATIAPPPSLVAQDEKQELQPSNFTGAGFAPSLGGSVAAKIMAKYGFKEGQGLGKQEQGMSQALQVEKTSKRGGKIIHERDVSKDPDSPQDMSQVESITEAMKNPSKVVLLKNMVGPGEVDEELEPEVKEECTRYGDVLKCVIFELDNTCEEEAVRIFVEFKRIESAIKAVVDLNGRFFGGRVVHAGFYNLDKFRRFEFCD